MVVTYKDWAKILPFTLLGLQNFYLCIDLDNPLLFGLWMQGGPSH